MHGHGARQISNFSDRFNDPIVQMRTAMSAASRVPGVSRRAGLSHRLAGWLDARPAGGIECLLFAVVVLFVWGLDTHGNYAGSGDDPHYQMIAHSLVFDRDLDLANDYGDTRNLVGAGTLQPGAHAVQGRDDGLRPVHDVGLPVLFAPYFAIAYQIAERSPDWMPPRVMARARLTPPLVLGHLMSLAMIALTGLIGVLLFRVCQSVAESRGVAAFWSLLFVLSPPLLSHSFLFFTEVPTALVVTFCWLALNDSFPQNRARSALLGTAVGCLLLLHVRNVGLVLGLAGLLGWRIWHAARRVNDLSWFLAPLVLFGLIRTAVNFTLWGTLVTSPHASMAAPASVTAAATEMVVRGFGLLTGQERGLLAYAPVYLLVLPGFFLLGKTDRNALRDAGVLLLAYLVPVLLPWSNRHGWDGGWAPAARLLVPVAPVLAAVGFRYAARLGRCPHLVAVVCLVQIALDLLYWSHPKLLWSRGTGRSALASFLAPPGLDVGAWLPSWHSPSLYTVVLSLVAVGVWTILSARVVGNRKREVC